MPKRRRLLTPMKKKQKPANNIDRGRVNFSLFICAYILQYFTYLLINIYILDYSVESTPRGRLKGALLYALEPVTEESDASLDKTPVKRER